VDLLAASDAEEVVNVIVEGGAVPVLVCHLKVPPTEAAAGEEHQPRPFEHEVEKGAAFALGLLAVKVRSIYLHSAL
jgi:hypothetical protein